MPPRIGDPRVRYGMQIVEQPAAQRPAPLLVFLQDDQRYWPGSYHVCWTNVYGHPRLYRWLLDPSAWP
jgi:hypothetical protein